MKNSNKKILAWILILLPAFYIAYHSLINGAFSTSMPHTYVFILVIIWIIGDIILSRTKK